MGPVGPFYHLNRALDFRAPHFLKRDVVRALDPRRGLKFRLRVPTLSVHFRTRVL